MMRIASYEFIQRYRALFNGVRAGDEQALRSLLVEGMQMKESVKRKVAPESAWGVLQPYKQASTETWDARADGWRRDFNVGCYVLPNSTLMLPIPTAFTAPSHAVPSGRVNWSSRQMGKTAVAM